MDNFMLKMNNHLLLLSGEGGEEGEEYIEKIQKDRKLSQREIFQMKSEKQKIKINNIKSKLKKNKKNNNK